MNKKSEPNKYKVFLILEDGIEIRTDSMNWMLYIPTHTYWYYPSLPFLLNDLIDQRIKQITIENPKQLEQAISKAINNAVKEMEEIVSTLMVSKTSSLSSLKLQEDTEEIKDD